MCQIGEPVKPVTTSTPSLRGGPRGVLHLLGGALAHALGIAVAPDVRRQDRPGGARRSGRTPPGRRGGCRSPRPTARGARASRAGRRSSRRRDTASATSKWSPQQASSSPSKPQPPHFSASSSSGRSAHWPVNSVTGRLMLPPSWTGSRGRPPAAHVGARHARLGSAGSVTIRSSSSAAMIVSSDARPNLVASISATLRSAPARAALTTSASGRREVVSPCSSVTPAHETKATSKLSCDRNSTVQRPASIRMCWSSSPGATTTCIGSALHLVGDRRRVGDERELVGRVVHQPPGERRARSTRSRGRSSTRA